MLKQLDQAALSYQIVLTKRDEVKLSQIEKTIADAQAALRGHPAAHPEVMFVSSHKGDGMSEFRETIARLCPSATRRFSTGRKSARQAAPSRNAKAPQ